MRTRDKVLTWLIVLEIVIANTVIVIEYLYLLHHYPLPR